MIELSDENVVTRRKAVEIAAAVATFGVAMGIRPGSSMAQGKYEGKFDGKGEGKFEGKRPSACATRGVHWLNERTIATKASSATS